MQKEARICKTCRHFEQIQGLFGKCVKLNFKETEYVFATDPACCQYDPKDGYNSRTAPHRNNNKATGLFEPYLPMVFPTVEMAGMSEIPSISNRFVKDNQPKEKWINPIFRRRYPAQKVIKIGHGADGKMKRMS